MPGIKALSTSIFGGLFMFRSLKRVRGLQIPRFIHNPQPFQDLTRDSLLATSAALAFKNTWNIRFSRRFSVSRPIALSVQCAGLRADVRSNDPEAKYHKLV